MLKDDKSLASRGGISREGAEAIAVDALAFIAGDGALFERFQGVTGLEVASLREAARTPGFLPGVLDFILAHEPTLDDFSAASGHSPETVVAARRCFGPDDTESAVR